MKKSILLLGLALSSSILVAEDVTLDKVTIESSTISDMAVDTKTEVSTVNTIDEKIITDINPKNINDLLQTIPGVTADVRSDVVEIHIRGIGQQEFMWEDTGVAVVIDGVPVMQDGGKVRGLNIDEIESIKVIKGGASYLYGANALAGAIIITTKKSKDKNGGYLSVEGGSYGYQDYKAKFYKSADKYSYNLMGGYKYEDGYWYQTQNDKKTASGKFTYFIDDMSDITLNADYTGKYQETTRGSVTGVTEAEENPTGEDDGSWAYSHDYYSDIYKYYIRYNKDFTNGSNLMVNTYYYKDLYDYLSSPQDTNGDGRDDTYTSVGDKNIKQYGLKSEFRGDINSLAYMLGLDIGKREYESSRVTIVDYSYEKRGRTYYVYDGEGTISDSTSKNYAVYSELKYIVNNKLTFVGNMRYDIDKNDYDADTTDYDGTVWTNNPVTENKTFTNLTYRLGTTYQIQNDNTLYANISTGFRNPRVEDMYAGDVKGVSRGTTYVNNPDLDTETTITYEMGLRGKIVNDIRYEASVFITDTKDIIAKTGGTYYSGDEVYYDNVGDARNQGLELSLRSSRNKKVAFSLSYTYLDAYYTSHNPFYVSYEDFDTPYDIVGNQLPRVPHHKLDLIVYYKPIQKLEFMGELYAQSHYYADETNFVTMPGYAKINLKATYRYNKSWEFFAKIDNVLDKQYYRTVYVFKDRDTVDTNGDGVPDAGDDVLNAEDASITVDPGRVWYAGFKYKF